MTTVEMLQTLSQYGVIGFVGYKQPESIKNFVGYKKPQSTAEAAPIIFMEAMSETDVIRQLKQMNMNQFQDTHKITEEGGHLVAISRNGSITGGILLANPVTNDALKELFQENGVKIALLSKEKSKLVQICAKATEEVEA